jgi:small subunit ribosomal protein S4e
MVKKLKRLLAPAFWKVPKKLAKFVVSPRPGPHKKFECIPLQIIVRDILKLAETGKEAKAIIKKGEILVDGKPRKDHAYPVGLFDSLAIPKIKKFYRVVPTGKGLDLIEIPEEESKLKICRIKDKKILKKGKLQLNLHDGRNLLVEKDIYKTGDSLLIELPSQKILQHVKLESGNLAIITKGKNSGKIVKIQETVKGIKLNKVICLLNDKKIETLKDFVFVVGKEKPLIKVS